MERKGSYWHWDRRKIDTNLSFVSFPSARHGGEEVACSCSRRDGNRPEVRRSIKSCCISPLWPSPSSHRSSKSFLKLMCSCWHVVLILWFHNRPAFSRGDAYRGEEPAGSWSRVSRGRDWISVRCCKTYEEDVSLMFLRCDVRVFGHLKGVVLMWVGSVWFNADQLLNSIWWYFFWPVLPVGPVCFVQARFLLLFVAFLLRMIWAVSAKCMRADGFACTSFNLNIIFLGRFNCVGNVLL